MKMRFLVFGGLKTAKNIIRARNLKLKVDKFRLINKVHVF